MSHTKICRGKVGDFLNKIQINTCHIRSCASRLKCENPHNALSKCTDKKERKCLPIQRI